MHCIAQYPPTDFNESRFKFLVQRCLRYRLRLGYSDHYPSLGRVREALDNGASIIEKHIQLPGAKHIDSPVCMNANKHEINMFRHVTETDTIGIERPTLEETDSDKKDVRFSRRYWVATKFIAKNTPYCYNVALKRCVSVDDPPEFVTSLYGPKHRIKGLVANKAYAPGDPITR